jgi:hypothetical protein
MRINIYNAAVNLPSTNLYTCVTSFGRINLNNTKINHNVKWFHFDFLFFHPLRYGREDEEVMGLKFCNEAIIALQQIWPKIDEQRFELSPLQVCEKK